MRIGQRFFEPAQLHSELGAFTYFIGFFHSYHLSILAAPQLPHPPHHRGRAFNLVFALHRPPTGFPALHLSHQLHFEPFAVTNHFHRYLGFLIPNYQPISGRDLGLQHLKPLPPAVGIPLVIPLLDDADPLILTLSIKLLEHWSGQNFAIKISDTVATENETTGLKEYSDANLEKAKAGAARAMTWWAEHQSEFPPVKLKVPPEAYSTRRPVPAGDFQLRTLEGKHVKLSDFRGKVVLINFWTTWCTACVSEMPELIALQKKHADNLVIVGVSLDYVPDSHGHIGGHAAVEEQKHSDGDHDDHEANAAALKRVREKVARTVKARGINYPILLDEKNEVGGRFNGGELPTTVIVDAQGNVRRRFVGARNLPVFEAMIAEASQIPILAQTGKGQ